MIETLAHSLDILMFAAMFGAILLGFPVFLSLTGVALIFAGLGTAAGVMPLARLQAIGPRVFDILTNNTLLAIPLFVLMGVILQRSGIAEELLEEMGRLFGRIRGGLGVSVTVVGALLAASIGIVGATVVAMAMVALPTMLRNNYDPRLAAGTVTAAGTLGQIIPPSTMLIILADVMASGYQQAQYAQGEFTVETLSVGEIFAATLLPGLVLVGLMVVFLLAVSWLRPGLAPAMPTRDVRVSLGKVLAALLPPLVLIVLVLGSILLGIATPTESAAVGAAGALILAGSRIAPDAGPGQVGLAGGCAAGLLGLSQMVDMRFSTAASLGAYAALGVGVGLSAGVLYGLGAALWHSARARILGDILDRTLRVTAMIFATIIGATVFSLVFHTLGGQERVTGLLEAMPGGMVAALLFVMAVIFVMGFFLDFVEISVIVLPIVVPVLIIKGAEPIWLAVLIAMNLQTSFMTPPFGFSLFYLRGAAPPAITTGAIYQGVLPFIVLQVLGMGVVLLVPGLASWLPGLLFG
jgi:TRAP-type mannitol/chloroaromatic compound transport system permease large subunit